MKYFGSTSGLTTLAEDTNIPANGMVAYVTSSYNSGYQNGDIKLATLSDTDATNVTGSELVTNGDFATSSDWVTGSYWSIGSGVATKSAAGGGTISQTLSLTSGALYVMSVDVTSYTSGDIQLYVDGTYYNVSDSTGIKTATFNAPDASVVIGVYGNAGSTFSVDNISVRLAEEDRSVNGNGLQVFGTVTKSAVATGADLVAYSGFNTSNYLRHPVNQTGITWNSDDWCLLFWGNSNALVSIEALNTLGYNNTVMMINVTPTAIATRCSNSALDNNHTVTNSGWELFAVVQRGGQHRLYKNGKLLFTENETVVDRDASINIGINSYQGVYSSNTSTNISLLRVSATAPSDEQIAKIYEDEKVLFQEGAKAVLAGTSDAVTSLAYDDDQQELLVGTSQYTSVFRGLRRVEEISGSASAISASNGLRVIED